MTYTYNPNEIQSTGIARARLQRSSGPPFPSISGRLLLSVPGGALGVALLLEVCNLLEIDDLERPCESVSSAAHHGQTHVLEQVIDVLRPPVRAVVISRSLHDLDGRGVRTSRTQDIPYGSN